MRNKPWASFDEQIEILHGRGLEDAEQFRHELETLGYYPLSGYAYPLRQVGLKGGVYQRLDDFYPQVCFEHVVELYEFDRRLRFALWQAICRLEVCFRTDIGYELGRLDSYIHEHLEDYQPSPRKRGTIGYFKSKLDKSIETSREEYVQHHKERYAGRIPVWAVSGILDFGQLCKLYSLAPDRERRAISERYGARADELASWMHTIRFMRNVCAHHARLWNKKLVKIPSWKHRREDPLLSPLAETHDRSYGGLLVIAYLLRRGGYYDEIRALRDVLATFPEDVPVVSLANMGAKPGWEGHAIWSLEDELPGSSG